MCSQRGATLISSSAALVMVEGVGDDAWVAFAAAAATIAAIVVLTIGGGRARRPPRADENRPAAADGSSGHVDCPVCLDRVPCGGVRAPCAHGMCAPCFARLWAESRRARHAVVTCPLCRRAITAVIVPASTRSCAEPRVAAAVADALRFNREAARRELSWGETLRDAPHLAREAFFDRGVRSLIPPLVRLRMVCVGIGAVAYVLAPFDLLPEAQLGAPGVLDDVAVTALAVLLVAEAFRGAILSGAP